MRPKWSRKKTYGLSLNPVNPDEAELMTLLDGTVNQSALLKQALRAYLKGGGQEPLITERELADLRARIHWLEQNQAAPADVAQRPAAAAQPVKPGHELSEGFKAAIIKAAKPGLRLEN